MESTQLFEMVLQLVAVMIFSGGVAAYMFRNVFNLAFILGAFAVTVIMIFVNMAVAATNIVPLIFISVAVFGASAGADICGFALAYASYKKKSPRVAYEAIGVGMVVMGLATAAAAFVATMSGINFQGLNVVMMGGLFLLIGISVVALFVRFNKITEMIIASVASIFWIVYLVIDFNRVVNMAPTWSNAVSIAMKVYLDMLNLLLQLIKLYILFSGDD